MGSDYRVKSRFRRDIDDEAIALAVVMLARILAEDEDGELADVSKVAQLASALATPSERSADRPLKQRYFEEVEALKADGYSNAEAIREVAGRHGKREMSVRQAIYIYRRELEKAA